MNKKVTKALSLLLVLVMTISIFVSCGSGEQKEEKKDYVMPEEKANINTSLEYKFLDDEYRSAINGGRLEKISYTAHKYYGDGGEVTKEATVYLPAGYDESDLLYNVLYLLHGAGGNEETYMGTQENPTELKYIIDNAIEKGDIKPLIIVMPTSESDDDADEDLAREISNGFYKEVVSDIVPAVEGKYRSAAYGNVSEENLKATRLHRAFGGFSMGSVSTWAVLEHAMDYFGYFLPMSGGSWTIKVNGDSKKPQETAKALEDAVKKQGYGDQDFFLYVSTGSADSFGQMMDRQMSAMLEIESSVFVFTSESYAKGNLFYNELQGGKHEHEVTYEYIFNALHSFF